MSGNESGYILLYPVGDQDYTKKLLFGSQLELINHENRNNDDNDERWAGW